MSRKRSIITLCTILPLLSIGLGLALQAEERHDSAAPPTVATANQAGFTADALVIDNNTISARYGGQVNFTLDAGPDHAWEVFIIFGSVSGTTPGTMLPGGLALLPLNFDYFSVYLFTQLNSPVFLNFLGALNWLGQAEAKMDTESLPAVSPGCIGTKLYFAFATVCNWDFTSNPVEIDVVY